MKLTPEQLVEWFIAANPKFTPEFRRESLALLETPPAGATRSQIISGLKQGINDTLADVPAWSEDYRQKAEAALSAKGLPSLRKMEAILKQKHQRILARGRIKDDEEFQLVAEILSDMNFEVSDSDRAKLGKIRRAYEDAREKNSRRR